MRRLSTAELADLNDWARLLRNDPCCYCGCGSEHLDHIHPVALGGTQTWDNLTAACAECNRAKHAEPLLRFLLKRAG